eukprot:UN22641
MQFEYMQWNMSRVWENLQVSNYTGEMLKRVKRRQTWSSQLIELKRRCRSECYHDCR